MLTKPLTHNGRILKIQKAFNEPSFGSKSILVENTWDYIELHLKRHGLLKSSFYWSQAESFYEAYRILNQTSKPLLAYYCCLNAAKALLEAKGIVYSDKHGVTGHSTGTKTALSNEYVTFKANGVLGSLCDFYEETSNNDVYSLYDLFYNLPFIHRAFDLTYSSPPELFIPVDNPHYVKAQNSEYCWVSMEVIDYKYQNGHILNKIPTSYERDHSYPDRFVIRKKKRFKWKTGKANKAANIGKLTKYHRKVRKDLYCIHGSNKYWYLKRSHNIKRTIIPRSTVTMIFGAMHRLSELSRYNPQILNKHFESQHNWLLNEFINLALYQFIDSISSDITGQEFIIPGINYSSKKIP